VTFRPPEPDREYLALLTELPLRRFRDLGAFLLHTWRIQGQLRRTPGLMGYSLRARPLRRQFWTLSVWEGDDALRRFVGASPHAQVMAALQGKMGRTRFVRWRLRGADYPPPWPEALAKSDTA
jgi:hypothetical protein